MRTINIAFLIRVLKDPVFERDLPSSLPGTRQRVTKVPGVSKALVLTEDIVNKITKDHGDFPSENFVITANKPSNVVILDDGNKINIVKQFGEDQYFVIGANKTNGYFTVTYFEPEDAKYVERLLKKGENVDFTGRARSPFATSPQSGTASQLASPPERFSGVSNSTNAIIPQSTNQSQEVTNFLDGKINDVIAQKPQSSFYDPTKFSLETMTRQEKVLKDQLKRGDITPQQYSEIATNNEGVKPLTQDPNKLYQQAKMIVDIARNDRNMARAEAQGIQDTHVTRNTEQDNPRCRYLYRQMEEL